jgi:hypothetical protein
MEKIPPSIIGLLSAIFPAYYTHAAINSLFLYAGAPEPTPEGSKATKVETWLRKVNTESNDPLIVLGVILDDLLERTPKRNFLTKTEYESYQSFERQKTNIMEALSSHNLMYSPGGKVSRTGTSSTFFLEESVKKRGLPTVDIEIRRALAQIENDPAAAAHYAGNVLEAALKAYLDHKSKSYGTGDGLSDLWKSAKEQMGLRPEDWDSKDLQKIASGLNNIVDGIMHLRNTKSGAHGRSEKQALQFTIRPRHARLAIHAAHTVAAYVIELID